MSKRIKQTIAENGDTFTTTTGNARGTLPNFDVSIFSPTSTSKKGSEMTIKLEGFRKMTLSGRNINTLYDVLDRHFNGE